MSVSELFKAARSPEIFGASIRISLVVGTVLNIINQSGRIIDGLGISWIHAGLNYLVPFCVASYSAAKNQLRR